MTRMSMAYFIIATIFGGLGYQALVNRPNSGVGAFAICVFICFVIAGILERDKE